tara:strand:+ start:1062 stop:1829 length:768 start_codon:yes stop_codon:yes gene_type:complete
MGKGINKHLLNMGNMYFNYFKNKLFFVPKLRTKDFYDRQKEFYSQFIKKGSLVFDIGSHIGDKTAVFLSLGAVVVSIEPQKPCVRYIKKRFLNYDDKSLVVLNKGLSNEVGMQKMYICDGATTISTFSDQWKDGRFKDYIWGRSKIVPVTTLDAVISEYGVPDFCKIDVEGFEYNVLKGLSRPIRNISFEFVKEFLDQALLCMKLIENLAPTEFNWCCGTDFQFENSVSKDELYYNLNKSEDSLLNGDIYSFSSI